MYPLLQPSASHPGHGLVQNPEQGTFLSLVKEGMDEFQILLGRFIDDHEVVNSIKGERLEIGEDPFLIRFRIVEHHGGRTGSQRKLRKGRWLSLQSWSFGHRLGVIEERDQTVLEVFLESFEARVLLKI